MRVVLSQRAERDISEIVAWLVARSPLGAERVLGSIEAAIRFIGEHPFGAPRTSRVGVRVKLVPAYPYKVYYRVLAQTVDIVHVRHSARRPVWTR